jgi:hypothetical protein
VNTCVHAPRRTIWWRLRRRLARYWFVGPLAVALAGLIIAAAVIATG